MHDDDDGQALKSETPASSEFSEAYRVAKERLTSAAFDFRPPVLDLGDPEDMPDHRTAAAAEETAKAIARLVVEAEEAERREDLMLRWTIAGVVLAGIAAVASVVAIVIAL